MSIYLINVICYECGKEESIESFVPKDKFLQGYIDRKTYYRCMSCWNKRKIIKYTPDIIKYTPYNRFDIMDI